MMNHLNAVGHLQYHGLNCEAPQNIWFFASGLNISQVSGHCLSFVGGEQKKLEYYSY